MEFKIVTADGPVERAVPVESSPRSRVWRAEVRGTPVVVKQLIDAPEADERYAREVAALRLAAHPPIVPRLLGTDPGRRVLVLEQVDHHPPGPDWVVSYATALARLHAAGSGARARPSAVDPTRAGPVRGESPPWAGLGRWAGPGDADVDAFVRLAGRLGVTVGDGARDEAYGLVARLGSVEANALLHGDPCPGNDLHGADGSVRFIDFEQASLGNGIVELAYLRIGFPTCWCSTSPEPGLLRRAEDAYRATWREATGTDVTGDLTDACAGWLLRGDALVQRAERGTADHLGRLPERDWTWGVATARERLAHRLGVVGAMATGDSTLAEFGRLARDLRAAVDTHWPGLAPLPALRPPS